MIGSAVKVRATWNRGTSLSLDSDLSTTLQRSPSQVQLRGHSGRSEEAHRRTDWYRCIEDSAEEMVRDFVARRIHLHPLICLCPSRYTIYKDHITLGDYEIHDGMSLEMY